MNVNMCIALPCTIAHSKPIKKIGHTGSEMGAYHHNTCRQKILPIEKKILIKQTKL